MTPHGGTDERSADARPLVEHFFRHESANLVAVLVRAFGVARIDLIEDVVQAAMLEAMNSWKHDRVPQNPAGWIHRVAKRRLVDTLRRERVHQRALAFAQSTWDQSEVLLDSWLEEDQVPDSLLRMMFVCCHPDLDRASQIALTLKILCGFGVTEIARGLLSTRAAIKKRIQRAKAQLAALNPRLDLPETSTLNERLAAVHDVLYLLFNEGYSPSRGAEPLRDDLCEEATRLCHMLCVREIGSATTKALLALMLFHAARSKSRVDADGGIVLLEDQDRTQWNGAMFRVAEAWLVRSSPESSADLTHFHLEAAIARKHCMARNLAATDWAGIVKIYDRLIERRPSAIYAMNRAVARAQLGDTSAAGDELDSLLADSELRHHVLLTCARARVFELAGDFTAARQRYTQAAAMDVAEHEATLLHRKIAKLAESP